MDQRSINSNRIVQKPIAQRQENDIKFIDRLFVQVSSTQVHELTGKPILKIRDCVNTYFKVNKGETSMDINLMILVNKYMKSPKDSYILSEFEHSCVGKETSLIRFIMTFNQVFIERVIRTKPFIYDHRFNRSDEFLSHFQQYLLNWVYKFNPSFDSTICTQIMDSIGDLSETLSRSDLVEQMNRVSSELLATIKWFLPRVSQKHNFDLFFQFNFGDVKQEMLSLFDGIKQYWVSIIVWETYKLFVIFIDSRQSTSDLVDFLSPMLRFDLVKLKSECGKPMDPSLKFKLDSIDMITSNDHMNEIVATLSDIDNKCQSKHVIEFEFVSCKFKCGNGELCEMRNGEMLIKNGDTLFEPPFQTIHIAIWNHLTSQDVQVNQDLTALMLELISWDCTKSCKCLEDLLILLSLTDQFSFEAKRDTKFEEFINKVKSYLITTHHIEFQGIDLVEYDAMCNIVLNTFMHNVFKLLSDKTISIKMSVKWMHCEVIGDIESWREDLFKGVHGCDSKSLTIKRMGSSLISYISLNSLKRQLAKCSCIGMNKSGLRRRNLINTTGTSLELSLDERAERIQREYEQWTKSMEKFEFDAHPINMLSYGKNGGVMIDGESIIPNYIYVRNLFEAQSILSEETQVPFERYELKCTFKSQRGIDILNHTPQLLEDFVQSKVALYYHEGIKKGVLLPVRDDGSSDLPKSNFGMLSKLKFSINEEYEETPIYEIDVSGSTYHISFLYNKDLSSIQCYLPKSIAEFIYVPRNNGEYFKLVKTSEGSHYEPISVVAINDIDGVNYYYEHRRIQCYECTGELVKVSWHSELNNLHLNSTDSMMLKKLNTMMSKLSNRVGDMFIDLPTGIKAHHQLVPIIRSQDGYVGSNLNPQWSKKIQFDYESEVEIDKQVQLFLDLEDMIMIKNGNTVYKLKEGGKLYLSGQLVSPTQIIKQVHSLINEQSSVKRVSETVDLKFAKLLYLQQISQINFYCKFVEVNKLNLVSYYVPQVCLSECKDDLPMIKCANGSIGVGKNWISSQLIEFKKEQKIEWKLVNGKLIIPVELKEAFPDINLNDALSDNDWYNKLHSIVELCFQRAVIKKGRKCDIEFTTSSGNERDVLIDGKFIVEVKTQTLYNRALESFLDQSKHIGESLLATTRHSLFISKFILDEVFDKDYTDLQVICDIVCGYNEMRDNNKRIVNNLFERMNLPQKVNRTTAINTQIKHDYLSAINDGIEPPYHKKLRERFDEPEFDKLLKNMTIADANHIELLLNQNQHDVELQEIEQQQAQIEQKINEIMSDIVELDSKLQPMFDMLNDELTGEVQFTDDQLRELEETDIVKSQKQLELEQLEQQINDVNRERERVLDAILTDEFIDEFMATRFEGTKLHVELDNTIQSHDYMNIELGNPIVIQELNSAEMTRVAFTKSRNFNKLAKGLSDLEFECRSNVKRNGASEPITKAYASGNINLKIEMSEFKTILCENTKTNKICRMTKLPNMHNLFSELNELNVMDVLIIFLELIIIENKIQWKQTSWGGSRIVDISTFKPFEIKECLNYVWLHYDELMNYLKDLNVQFVRCLSALSMDLSFCNLEFEVRVELDTLINAFINKCESNSLKSKRLDFVKLCCQLLFSKRFNQSLKKVEFDTAFKVVKFVLSSENSGGSYELPKDICFVESSVKCIDQTITTQNMIKNTLSTGSVIHIEDLNSMVTDLSFEVTTLDLKFDFD